MTPAITRQMIAAEILKLRRNRALLAFCFLLSVVTVALFFGYDAVQHASDPAHRGPAGGIDGFDHGVRLLGLFFGALTAALIGTEAGTADLSSGVFRDLVATGRSRLGLFSVRTPAALAMTLVFNGAGFLLAVLATFVFAGGLPTPSAGVVLQSAGWIVLANALVLGLAVGIGSLTGSRGVTLVAVIGWHAVASPLLLNVTSLGSARDGLLTAALGQLAPVSAGIDVKMATATAIVVLACWALVPAAVGAWRTRTQDA